MQLYLTRHTESTYNVKGVLNADPTVDVKLSENGIIQANELAKKLNDVSLEVIYISELPRTGETASIINYGRGLSINIDKRINENVMGFEGHPISDYTNLLGDGPDRLQKKFNGGESLAEVQSRVESFLYDLKNSDHNKTLVITHGCIIECIYSLIHNQEFNYGHGHIIPQGDCEIIEI